MNGLMPDGFHSDNSSRLLHSTRSVYLASGKVNSFRDPGRPDNVLDILLSLFAPELTLLGLKKEIVCFL